MEARVALRVKMLGQVRHIALNIAIASAGTLKALHHFVFGNEGNKFSSKRLLGYNGFNFSQECDDYDAKLRFAFSSFVVGDLVSISIILRVSYSRRTNKKHMSIFNGL